MLKKTFALTLIVQLLCAQFVFAQTRGVGVRVRTANGQTAEVKLYDGSYALIIGESDYANGWDNLPGVRSDVRAVKQILEQSGFKVETAENLTRQQFEERLRKFIDDYGFQANNRLLIYYAGHGHTLRSSGDGRELGYIVLVDAPDPARDETGFRRRAISMDTIQNYAKEIQSKHAIFIFDSCFSGKLVSRERVAVPPVILENVAYPVRQFITAGAANQSVPDESIFRRTFVRGLEGEADRNDDGYVTGTELAEFLKEKVTNYSDRRQTPQYGKINDVELDRGDFVFVVNKSMAVQPVPSPRPTPVPNIIETVAGKDKATLELEAWSLVRNSSDAQDFRSFLKEFPNGANALNAKIKLEQTIWDSVKSSGEATRVKTYLDEFPDGANAPAGRILYGQLTRSGVNTSGLPTPVNANSESSVTLRNPNVGMILERPIGNGLSITFMGVPPGSFVMGAPDSEIGKGANESPLRTVTILNGFWMGKYEVTQEEYEAVTGSNPSKFKNCPKCPVEMVSWYDAQSYVKMLNARNDGFLYSLPTESEWEYAARAGTITTFAFGDNLSSVQANFNGVHPFGTAAKGPNLERTTPVGNYQSNAWGLYDMHGNVWEWCEDIYKSNYNGLSLDGSANLSLGDSTQRILRGGSWGVNGHDLRSADRFGLGPGVREDDKGFRLVARMK